MHALLYTAKTQSCVSLFLLYAKCVAMGPNATQIFYFTYNINL